MRPVMESCFGCGCEDLGGESIREEYNEGNVIRNEWKWGMNSMRNDLNQNFERLRLDIDNKEKKGMEESPQDVDELQHQLTEAQEVLQMKQEVRLGLQQELCNELEQMTIQYQQQGDRRASTVCNTKIVQNFRNTSLQHKKVTIPPGFQWTRF